MTSLNTGNDLLPTARVENDVVIGQVFGEIDLHNSPDLRGVLLELVTQYTPRRLILNLRQVTYMDSSAVAVLVEMLQRLRGHNGRVYLTNLQPRVRGLLEIARLNTIFILCADEEEATGR